MADRIDEEMSLVAKKLKEERRKAGLTQLELSMRAGVSQNMIAYIERGDRNPALRTVMKICNALDIRLSDLLEDIERPRDPKDREGIKDEIRDLLGRL